MDKYRRRSRTLAANHLFKIPIQFDGDFYVLRKAGTHDILKKNFLIIYLYCRSCRAKGDDKTVLCHDCVKCTNDTIKFVDLGPQDKAYAKKSRWS